MNDRRTVPPPRVSALFARVLPAAQADEIAGDLHEEFAARALHGGRRAASVWYVRQALHVGAHLMARSVARRLTPRVPDPPHPNPGDSPMRTIATEARHAIRSLWARPALTVVVVLTLSLSLASNASIFKFIDALIIRPFSLPEMDRLVMASETGGDLGDYLRESVAPATYRDWTKQLDVFERMAALEWWDVNLASGDSAEAVQGTLVTASFFDVVGVRPALGRAFVADDETPGRNRQIILSHAFWARRYAADPAIVGTTVLLDSEPYEIVGVMPEGFVFPTEADIFSPLAPNAEAAARRDRRYLTVIARLAPGRTLDEANTQIAVVASRLAQQYPATNKGFSARVVTLRHGMRDMGLGPIVALWQASAVLVLLIACANVAGLLLARGAERQREIAVRTALGASRGRIVRELLLESAALAVAAVPLALSFSWLALKAVKAGLPARLTRFVAGWESIGVDGRLVLFTLGVALAASVIFGALPALRGSRPALAASLKEGGRGSTAGRDRQRARRVLVVAQITLALPLLVAAALSTMGAHRFLQGSQGYDPDGLLVMRATLPETKYATPEARRRFVDAVAAGLSQLPGARSAGIGNALPSLNSNPSRALEIEGSPAADPANPPTMGYRLVTADLLSTLRIPVLSGRGFSTADTHDSLPVVMISRSAADRYFKHSDPIGRRIKLGDSPWLTVVGVCGDVIHDWFDSRNAPTAYRPYTQAPSLYIGLAIRTDGDPALLTMPARNVIRSVDAAQAVYQEMPMRQVLHEKTIGLQYVAAIMGVFGAIALLLAVVGVYGVMAMMVAQRRHEIGVRIALGAGRQDVLRLTVGQAARLTAVGVVLGVAASFAVSRMLEAAIVGVLAADMRVTAGVAAVLVASGLVAGYVPARRATTIDPIGALRGE